MTKYTIDRIESNIVVLLKKGNETDSKDVPIDFFPKEIKDGDIVEEIDDEGRRHYKVLKLETDLARKKASDILNKLRNKK